MNLELMNNERTMSSLEIAELTGKQHKHVLRDIEGTLNQAGIDGSKFGLTYKDSLDRTKRCYRLPRMECDLVISGYSVPYRMSIIKRWHELESQAIPLTYIDALKALVKSEEEKALAIATKAEIGHRREATAMNTASQAVKKANKLEVELDKSKEYCTVKRMQMLMHGQQFSWGLLRSASNEMDIAPIKIYDINYGTVNAYHADVWKEVYGLDIPV